MYPIVFEFLGGGLPTWLVMYVTGAISIFFLVSFTLKKLKNELYFETWPKLFALCYFSGWLGARSLSIAVEQLDVLTFQDAIKELFNFGSMTFYGGALGAFFVGACYVILKKQSVAYWLDCIIPFALLGLAIGRIGCFFNGDDYGKIVDPQFAWLGVRFPNIDDSASVLRYPAQIFESFGAITLSVTLYYYGLRIKIQAPNLAFADGVIGNLAIFSSASLRFGVEYFRGDARGYFPFTTFSTSQGIALILMAASLIFFLLKVINHGTLKHNSRTSGIPPK